jgi:uncharacterized membrane protein YqjE
MALLAARLDLIQLEAKSATRQKAKRASFVAAAAGCAVFTWLLLLAGAISWIAEAAGWPWSRVSIAAALLHGLAAFIFAKMAKSPAEEPFSVTKAEFRKDREWIESFKKTGKSNN